MRKVIAMANVPLDGMRKAPRHLIGTPEAGSPTAAGRCLTASSRTPHHSARRTGRRPAQPRASGRLAQHGQLGTPTGLLQERSLRRAMRRWEAAPVKMARKVPLLTRAVLPARPGRCETNQS